MWRTNTRFLTDFSYFEGRFPPRTVTSSRHYDLNTWFGPYLWLERGGADLRTVFDQEYGAREREYLNLLRDNLDNPGPHPSVFDPLNTHLALNDPARGILRAYFGPDFADDYLRNVLFSTSHSCRVC